MIFFFLLNFFMGSGTAVQSPLFRRGRNSRVGSRQIRGW